MLTPMELYSEYVFTTLKKVSGKIFDLESHLARLERQVCDYFFIDKSNELISKVKQEIVSLQGDNIRIRVNIFIKEREDLLFDNLKLNDLGFSINCKPLIKSRKFAKAKLYYGQNSSELENFKIANYVGSFYLRRKVLTEGYNEIIYKTSDNEILEASTSNLVFKLKEKWVTPKRYIYKGLSRQKLLDSFKVEELIVFEKDLLNCSDAYLINTIEGFVPLKNIDDFSFTNKNLREIQGE